jgi:amino acid adenylation domain-containing protein
MTTRTDLTQQVARTVWTRRVPGPVPGWCRTPAPGTREHREPIPDGMVADLLRLADDLGVPLATLLLTSHAKVLATLRGDGEVMTGAGSWRFLVLAIRDAYPDPAGSAPNDDDAIRLGIERGPDSLDLLLRSPADLLDAEACARVAGYHLTALRLLASDPEAAHQARTLVSAAEVRHQVEDLAGPRRTLPDERIHEMVERQVRAYPDATAVSRGGRHWTYRRLNARANRLARAIRARGLGREDVVAVVTERTLDWAAAVLAVLKAGGVYLPIEPGTPADRIASMLTRAGCRLVLTAAGSTGTLDRALASLPGVHGLAFDAAYDEGHADDDLGIDVTADQLAYIYFTSGSTGEPKGAMCEHGGLVNHVLAKVADLGIGPGTVVAQTAPQCFDISLWQLVSALVVGGRTLLVEQETILDVDRFLDTIVAAPVHVLQVVPSYLDVVLSGLDRHPRPLPDLRMVSVTGEAVSKRLVERWFAAEPGIPLVNAYGLTETSDDTNHEVMTAPPDGDRVPVGRPLPNVHVYVVDERLDPVPLGAPGEIVFSGTCVGRGYVNDPERTRRAFLADPHRPGERLYRSGDLGHWRPDGSLEFLGRRDSQVKVGGFRIEIGEIEIALARMPEVRAAAVVVAEHGDRPARLVAFYTGPRALEPQALRRHLRRSLPDYMVPSSYHWQETLPLTANGKVDRATLTARAGALADDRTGPDAPRTPAERRLAAAWASVLGVPEDRIRRDDHFFERGGTSLAAVRLAIALDRAVSLKDITTRPVLADLAAVLDHGAAPSSPPTSSRRKDPTCQPLLPCRPSRST